MTREEAIKIIQNEYKCVDRECDIERSCGKCPYMMPTKEPILKAYEMAIQALSQEPKYWMDNDGKAHKLVPMVQEPCTDTVSIRKDILKCRVGELVVYNVEWLKKHWQMEMDIVCGVKPCEDAISRDMALEKMADYVASGYADSAEDFAEYSRIICQLPSVNPTSNVSIQITEREKR